MSEDVVEELRARAKLIRTYASHGEGDLPEERAAEEIERLRIVVATLSTIMTAEE